MNELLIFHLIGAFSFMLYYAATVESEHQAPIDGVLLFLFWEIVLVMILIKWLMSHDHYN